MVGPAALAWPHVAYLALLALIIRLALTKINANYSPHVRYLRWVDGILKPQRRNSCSSSVSLREAPATPYISQVRRRGYLGLFGPMLRGLLRKRRERLRAVRPPLNGRPGLRRGRDGQKPECAPDHCVRTPSPRQAPVHLSAASMTPRWRGYGDVVAHDARPLPSRPAKRHAPVSVVSRYPPARRRQQRAMPSTRARSELAS